MGSVEPVIEFVKVEPADYEKNEENLACLVEFCNTAKNCDEQESNLATIKQEEIYIKSEENWDDLDENLQDHVSNEEQEHKKCSYQNHKKSVADYKTFNPEEDIKVSVYTCKNCRYKCSNKQLFLEHIHKCKGNCKTCNAQLKDRRIDQCTYCYCRGLAEVKTTGTETPKTSFYQCPHCPYATGVRYTYSWHLKRHQRPDKEDLAYCDKCPFYCRYKASLVPHIEKHRTKTDFPCKRCSYCATTATDLTCHKKLHQPNHKINISKSTETVHKCRLCPYACVKQQALKKHMACHDARTGIECQYCSFKTENAHLFGTHRKLHTLEPFKCKKCPYKTWKVTNFKYHSSTHFKSKPLNICKQVLMYCYECPYSNDNKTSLIRHIARHRRKTGYQCKYCSYRAIRAAHVKNHEGLHESKGKTSTKSAEKSHKCRHCPYTCMTQDAFERHEACHLAKIGKKCQYCSFKTESTVLFTVHRKLHTSEPFKCSNCSYETQRASHFKAHVLRHELESARPNFNVP